MEYFLEKYLWLKAQVYRRLQHKDEVQKINKQVKNQPEASLFLPKISSYLLLFDQITRFCLSCEWNLQLWVTYVAWPIQTVVEHEFNYGQLAGQESFIWVGLLSHS